jgi:nitrite reductase/ring-hydroxylating ferredoxin subunit
MRRVPAGSASDLVAGEPRIVALGLDERGLPREAIVLRDAAGTVRAYLNECRHLPIPLGFRSRLLTEDGGHLVCATHGATYRVSDGYCVEGPCEGLSLEGIVVEESGGELVLVFR